ncbi:MAG: hypothetical protein F6J89_11025 [Symploca sp. SIO1C4]|uniref:Uncharacterized protein n=1 Tax=Symploca sp. SIO1C4 TaxID=2607765 RepID=A0A6B3NER2_9CYAN|nr:hypothetical protein [Symploca sp. SIO1C4]
MGIQRHRDTKKTQTNSLPHRVSPSPRQPQPTTYGCNHFQVRHWRECDRKHWA